MLHHLTFGRTINNHGLEKDGYVSDLDWQMYCQEVLDANESVCNQYLFMQKCYNLSDKTHEDQWFFIRDIVWLYIDAVAMDLATQYGLLAKSREDIKDEMLAIDLEHRKAQLKIIDGGKA